MAIFDCPDGITAGITASIVIDGQSAREYPPGEKPRDENNVPTKMCYVESDAGQTFSVKITVDPKRKLSNRHGLLFRVLVDGKQVDSKVLHKSLTQKWIYYAMGPKYKSCIPGQSMRRLLTFAPVSTGKCVMNLDRIFIICIADFSFLHSGGCVLPDN